MKKYLAVLFLLLSIPSFAQTLFKVSGGLGNRWDEKLNSQTIGKGLRLSVEELFAPRFSMGIGFSYFSFNPNTLVNVRYSSYSFQSTYYFTVSKLQPFLGVEVGYCSYFDKTTIELISGKISQQRNKSYGSIAPKAGVLYNITKQLGVQLQLSADFIPIPDTAPIGFSSVNLGLTYKLNPTKPFFK